MRFFRSDTSLLKARIAIVSDAAIISNPLLYEILLLISKLILLKVRSLISIVLLNIILLGFILRGFLKYIELSSIALRRLLAADTAYPSPVKWRFISSIGIT